ncbi:uncharacterized protein B0I36DRAFT_371308 [Microdochium trichocladiopsis]|uniref:NAD-dependent epimerase/dehydratase domain-containing protein n=1 Tax=Microdochium trichocladiopsis TaxID=1682393 RepID=A0A9P8YID0_9PEZI|nr:uncharacterized protein B0I36DRAFT_371308 [Microdochium trichocladiopsis]KAH7040835.1 hypothetical protein B0I36DRAFT_371308 [Microdochium trichocladiopsis]
MASSQSRKSVLVTGANGYIGNAVCKAFVRAGWCVFGLVRQPEAAQSLAAQEVIPLLGSATLQDSGASDPSNTDELLQRYPWLKDLLAQTVKLDVIIGCSEQWPDYVSHYTSVTQFFRALASISSSNGTKPLVLWSSGCKDYGVGALSDAPDLRPHTEESPLMTEGFLAPRTEYSQKIFSHSDIFDAVLLRPTNVYGYNSSFYGAAFQFAEELASKGSGLDRSGKIEVPLEGRSIMHALHVDDCAEAYLALAEHSGRNAIAGQCFNISSSSFETTDQVVQALARDYSIAEKVLCVGETSETPGHLANIFGYSQWVDSSKIRAATGWQDKRLSFSQGIGVYRRAYEATKGSDSGSRNVDKLHTVSLK